MVIVHIAYDAFTGLLSSTKFTGGIWRQFAEEVNLGIKRYFGNGTELLAISSEYSVGSYLLIVVLILSQGILLKCLYSLVL